MLSANPEHTDSLNNIGKCLTERARQSTEPSKERDLARAYSSWMLALAIDPSHRMARMNVGAGNVLLFLMCCQVALHLHAHGHYAEALDHWKILLDSDPNDGEAAYNAAVSLQYLGQIEEAADGFVAGSHLIYLVLVKIRQVCGSNPSKTLVHGGPYQPRCIASSLRFG